MAQKPKKSRKPTISRARQVFEKSAAALDTARARIDDALDTLNDETTASIAPSTLRRQLQVLGNRYATAFDAKADVTAAEIRSREAEAMELVKELSLKGDFDVGRTLDAIRNGASVDEALKNGRCSSHESSHRLV